MMAEVKSILFVAASPKFGGTEKHLLDLVHRLVSTGWRISILCTGADVFSMGLSMEAKERIAVERIAKPESFGTWRRVFTARRPDVVVLVKSWSWCFPWYTLLAAWMAGVRRRYIIAHLPPSPMPSESKGVLARWRYRLSHRRLALFCDSTICVSDFIRQRLERDCLFPSRQLTVVRNGVSTARFHTDSIERLEARRRLAVPEGMPCLVCIASLVEQKRVDVLLEAMALVLQSETNWCCLVVGDGPLVERLRRQAAQSALDSHVFFHGFHRDVLPYLRAADLFVLTSDNEGLPLSVLEAMACGVPCVVTDVGGNAEIVRDEECGFVVPPRSPSRIAEAILGLLRDPQRRSAMGLVARDRVTTQFDIEISMARIQEKITGGVIGATSEVSSGRSSQ